MTPPGTPTVIDEAWRRRILRVVVAPLMVLMGAITIVSVWISRGTPLDPDLLLFSLFASALPLFGLLKAGPAHHYKVLAVACGPILLGWLIQTQQGPTLVPGVLLICGASVFAAMISLRAAVIATSLGTAGWLGIGWAQAQGLITPRWLALADPRVPEAWIWNGILTFLLMLSSVIMLLWLTTRLTAAIRDEQRLHDHITDEMRQQARAEAAHAAAEAAMARTRDAEALGRLASGVAHDFNNALMVLQASADLGAELTLDATQKQACERLSANARRAAALNRRLLAFGRPVQPSTRALDINNELTRGLAFIQPLLPEHVQLLPRLAAEPAVVVGEPTHIGQLLLLSALQARDRLPDGGALIIETERLPEGQVALRFIIEGGDHQPDGLFGLAPDAPRPPDLAAIESILDNLRAQVLGLPQGEKSRMGLNLVLRGQTELADEATVQATPTLQQHRVLLAEDEAAVRRLMAQYLAEAGMTVLEASDGQEALEIFQRAPGSIHLLCTDGQMPRLGGAGLVEAIRITRPDLPILLCSAFVDDDGLQSRLDQDDVRFLAKPFDRATLLGQIHLLMSALEHP